jgi:DNA (cytosine-5)-methyltransferase 1
MNKVCVFEMFSGYGGASFALKQAGIPHTVVGFSEIDKYAVQCFLMNHGSTNFGDCKTIKPEELPDFDLLTAGFPCQAFSVAGNMKGELDPRGTLFNEIIRIAEVKKPRWMLLENVKGLTSKKFEATFQKILSELDRIGYDVHWKVLNTKEYGIPQSRARVWFVCFDRAGLTKEQRNWRWPEPETLKIFIKDILEEEVNEKYYLSEKLQTRFKEYLEKKQTSVAALRQRDRHGKNEERQHTLYYIGYVFLIILKGLRDKSRVMARCCHPFFIYYNNVYYFIFYYAVIIYIYIFKLIF